MTLRYSIASRIPAMKSLLAPLLGVVLALGAMGCKDRTDRSPKRPPLKRLKAKGFSIPIPKRFFEEESMRKKAAQLGGVALLAIGRKNVPNAFRASIVVIPVKQDGSDFSKYDGTKLACEETLKGLNQLQGWVRMVELPAGRFCQFVSTDRKDKTRAASFTYFKQKGVNQSWGVTCNYDTRDDIARAACQTVLKGWRFEK